MLDIDTDTLLKKELVTLDEALKIANNAALLALNTISVLVSETYRRKIDVVHKNAKEINVSEVVNILGRYGEAKIGFGAAYDISASISQAIYDCPFIGAGIKSLYDPVWIVDPKREDIYGRLCSAKKVTSMVLDSEIPGATCLRG
ncbi:hypothetical protein SLEP1_g24365 [Rubroshorea leprosula]|uniref:Uncharacterized protein n=1 Tax=Rubroshorea leprosula TaxID=152421 RepID=A0AAV5JLH7_9ROSI|nr:hypothetical protein SLEP1_g24365 [Rubroshorea leprosula]